MLKVPMKFSVSQAHNGDYLLQQNLQYDMPEGSNGSGWQRFYVQGSGINAGTLAYCGRLLNFGYSAHNDAGDGVNEIFKVCVRRVLVRLT